MVYKCTVCKTSFAQVWKITQHIELVHESKKQLNCTECDDRFDNETDLTGHKSSVHEGKNQYNRCSNCQPCSFQLDNNNIFMVCTCKGFTGKEVKIKPSLEEVNEELYLEKGKRKLPNQSELSSPQKKIKILEGLETLEVESNKSSENQNSEHEQVNENQEQFERVHDEIKQEVESYEISDIQKELNEHEQIDKNHEQLEGVHDEIKQEVESNEISKNNKGHEEIYETQKQFMQNSFH